MRSLRAWLLSAAVLCASTGIAAAEGELSSPPTPPNPTPEQIERALPDLGNPLNAPVGGTVAKDDAPSVVPQQHAHRALDRIEIDAHHLRTSRLDAIAGFIARPRRLQRLQRRRWRGTNNQRVRGRAGERLDPHRGTDLRRAGRPRRALLRAERDAAPL